MPGETKSDISGWTVDTLHAHMQAIMNDHNRLIFALLSERDERYEQRFQAQHEALKLSSDLAKDTKASTNEWRGAMNDREIHFLPRAEFAAVVKEWADWRNRTVNETNQFLARSTYEREHKLLIDEVTSLRLQMTNWFSKSEGRGKGLSQGWGYIVGAAGFIVALIAIFVFLNSLSPKVEKMDTMRQQGISNKEDYYQHNKQSPPEYPTKEANKP